MSDAAVAGAPWRGRAPTSGAWPASRGLRRLRAPSLIQQKAHPTGFQTCTVGARIGMAANFIDPLAACASALFYKQGRPRCVVGLGCWGRWRERATARIHVGLSMFPKGSPLMTCGGGVWQRPRAAAATCRFMHLGNRPSCRANVYVTQEPGCEKVRIKSLMLHWVGVARHLRIHLAAAAAVCCTARALRMVCGAARF